MKVKLLYLYLLGMFFLPFAAKAQTHVWLDYYQYRLLTNDNWKLSQRFSLRSNPSGDYAFIAAYRPNFAHKVRSHGRVIVGSDLFYNQGTDDNTHLELRPWVGFKRSPSRLTRLSLTHYVRWENRIFAGNTSSVYESRLRYKVTADGDVYRRDGRAVSLLFEPEFFVSVGNFDSFYYNRLRVTGGTRVQWNPYWQTDFLLTRQMQQNANSDVAIEPTWILQLKLKRLLLKN